jgi:hypothetical protein
MISPRLSSNPSEPVAPSGKIVLPITSAQITKELQTHFDLLETLTAREQETVSHLVFFSLSHHLVYDTILLTTLLANSDEDKEANDVNDSKEEKNDTDENEGEEADDNDNSEEENEAINNTMPPKLKSAAALPPKKKSPPRS